MPFALPEYDATFGRFFADRMRVLPQAFSLLLSQIRFIDVPGTVASRVRSRDGMDISLDAGEMSTIVATDFNAVRDADFDSLYNALFESADAVTEQMVSLLVETLNKLTEGTGNVVSADGEPFSFELLYKALDSLEFSVDENNELVMPSLVMHPAAARKLKNLPDLTDEQQQKLERLKERKKEDALARRRRRRLS